MIIPTWFSPVFLKEYSILGNELKEKFIIKIKMSDES
jgi:hypothetical protein